MTQKIIQIGNSTGIILSKSVLEALGLKAGETVSVEPDVKAQAIVITKEGEAAKSLTVSPHFLTILDKVNQEYGKALKKLAEL